jgi:ABC-2 type transport system ATP-binding protein
MKSISARNLSKTYWFYEKEAGLWSAARALFRGNRVFVEAVREINLQADVGEVIGFIGPNGAGKTTTLKMLSGILYPTRGQVEVMGFVPSKREKAFLKSITFISGQRNRLFWDLPADDYFQFIKILYEIPEGQFKRNAKALIEMAEIGDILKTPQRKLSFGQRKRCELVAGLLHDPQIIFLDEPTNALDLINARKIREFIREKGKEGKSTILLTSHNLADIEQVCERIVIITAGKIVFDGSLRNLSGMDGFKRRIKIVFRGPWAEEKVRALGEIQGGDGEEILLEVQPEKVAETASLLFAQFPVKDLSITEPSLERIIESIYRKKIVPSAED